MSFELLDFINDLIAEETQELPAKQLVAETDTKHLPSDKIVNNYRNITYKTIVKHQQDRLSKARTAYDEYKQKESLYNRALIAVPDTVEKTFQQILEVVTSGIGPVPKGWTLAHREESSGKDNDQELKNIWVRMYMLGFIDDKGGL